MRLFVHPKATSAAAHHHDQPVDMGLFLCVSIWQGQIYSPSPQLFWLYI